MTNSTDDVDSSLSKLHEWQAAEEFGRLEEAIRPTIGQFPNHRRRRFKPWREAWVVSRFAKHTSASAARLLPETKGSPDAQLRYASRVIDVEVTEVIESGREPGNEKPGTFHDPVENWVKRADDLPGQLEKAIRAKLEKPYARRVTLLVYLNIGNPVERELPRLLEFVRKSVTLYRSHFDDIRILWRDEWD